MKGIVFTELLEMVEDTFGDEVLDKVIESSDLPNNGSYSAVGTYDHAELVRIVVSLSSEVNVEIPDLLKTYGRHIFKVFGRNYPQFFDGVDDAFSFLESIENHIHVEVRKLYPEAELPTFDSERINDKELRLTYYSTRKMGDFAHG
ncbi:MAG: heme NO-binding domain-containing protein, partial [Bacteroidota bacterium]